MQSICIKQAKQTPLSVCTLRSWQNVNPGNAKGTVELDPSAEFFWK